MGVNASKVTTRSEEFPAFLRSAITPQERDGIPALQCAVGQVS